MRLTNSQIQTYKVAWSRWRLPNEMVTDADALMDQMGVTDLFTQPGIGFVREAWIAGYFGKVRNAKSVRLITEERPDFSLQFNTGNIENYELVEADAPDRKRGREYRQAASTGQRLRHVPIEQWATAQQALEVINRVVNKKAERAKQLKQQGTPYPLGTSLLVYLNITDYGAHQSDIEAIFCQAVEPAKMWFGSIWILWKNRVYEI